MVLFSKDHVWARAEGTILRVGITDFAQSELGDIAYVGLPSVGLRLKRGDAACPIDSLKSSSEIYSPVSGMVTEIHEALAREGSCGAINSDPFGEGWLFELEMADPSELDLLMPEKDYRSFIEGS